MNLTTFSQSRIVKCGATIGPTEPISYNGLYELDDHFPAKDGKGTTWVLWKSRGKLFWKITISSHFIVGRCLLVHLNESSNHLNSCTNQFPLYSWMSARLCIVAQRVTSMRQQSKIYLPFFILTNNSELFNDINQSQDTILFHRYHLVGAICHKSDHFTATIVQNKTHYSRYNDVSRIGVENNTGGEDYVETAVYTLHLIDE